jgi:hypothetical protein
VAQQLRDAGYRAYAVRGGLDAWRDAGYAVEPKTAEMGRTLEDICSDCGHPLGAHGRGRSTGVPAADRSA